MTKCGFVSILCLVGWSCYNRVICVLSFKMSAAARTVSEAEQCSADTRCPLDKLDAEGVKTLLQSMSTLDGPMTALASSAVEYDVGLIDAAQAEVRQLHLIYTGLAAGLILCGVVLVILLLRHNKLLDRAHGSMQRLTSDLRQATGELQSQNFRLEHDAHHDALTGLPNRVLFRQDLEKDLMPHSPTASRPSFFF